MNLQPSESLFQTGCSEAGLFEVIAGHFVFENKHCVVCSYILKDVTGSIALDFLLLVADLELVEQSFDYITPGNYTYKFFVATLYNR